MSQDIQQRILDRLKASWPGHTALQGCQTLDQALCVVPRQSYVEAMIECLLIEVYSPVHLEGGA